MLTGAFATSEAKPQARASGHRRAAGTNPRPPQHPFPGPCRRLLEQHRVIPPQQNTPVTSAPPGPFDRSWRAVPLRWAGDRPGHTHGDGGFSIEPSWRDMSLRIVGLSLAFQAQLLALADPRDEPDRAASASEWPWAYGQSCAPPKGMNASGFSTERYLGSQPEAESCAGAKNGDCHQFAPHHRPRNKGLSLKRIGRLYPIFRDVYFHELLGR